MKVLLKKGSAGDAVVTFVRADGSATSGRLGSGGFGAVHDLTHYAVETTLGLRQGFFGLLAQGWNIPDFDTKGTAVQLPDEAVVVECIVGQLNNATFAGRELPAEELNWLVSAAVAGVRPGAKPPVVNPDTLQRMQQTLATLLARWRTLPPGGTLQLDFPAG